MKLHMVLISLLTFAATVSNSKEVQKAPIMPVPISICQIHGEIKSGCTKGGCAHVNSFVETLTAGDDSQMGILIREKYRAINESTRYASGVSTRIFCNHANLFEVDEGKFNLN